MHPVRLNRTYLSLVQNDTETILHVKEGINKVGFKGGRIERLDCTDNALAGLAVG